MENKKHVQRLKLLVLTDLTDFGWNDVMEELNRIKRRHYDLVVVFGDIEDHMLTEVSCLFDTAIIALLPEKHYPRYFEDGVMKFNMQKFYFGTCSKVMGYGGNLDNPEGNPDIEKYEDNFADLFFSFYPPYKINMEDEMKEDKKGRMEVNKYGAYRNPRIVFHAGRKNRRMHTISNGTKYISCYGIQEFQIRYWK